VGGAAATRVRGRTCEATPIGVVASSERSASLPLLPSLSLSVSPSEKRTPLAAGVPAAKPSDSESSSEEESSEEESYVGEGRRESVSTKNKNKSPGAGRRPAPALPGLQGAALGQKDRPVSPKPDMMGSYHTKRWYEGGKAGRQGEESPLKAPAAGVFFFDATCQPPRPGRRFLLRSSSPLSGGAPP